MLTTILVVVENHNFLRRALRRWLEVNFPMCHVIEANSREKACAVAQTHVLHVFLMIVGLQEVNNLKIMGQIKAAALVVPVVILTTYEDELYQSKAIRAGASACISMLTALPPIELQVMLAPLLFDQAERGGYGQKKAIIGSSLTYSQAGCLEVSPSQRVPQFLTQSVS